MSYRYCAVVGCHNSGRGLKKWKDGFCNIHQMNYGMGKCICEPPFRLFPFPTELQDLEGRWRWIKNVNRLDRKTGKLWIPSVNCRICSKHFVDGEPSLSNPNPTLFMGLSKPSLSNLNPTLFMGLSDTSLGKKARRQMSRDAIKLVFGVSDQVCHNRAVQPHKMARGSVFAKTAGLSDKTDKFQKCPANFVSLPVSMSEEESIQKTPGQFFLVTWSSMNED